MKKTLLSFLILFFGISGFFVNQAFSMTEIVPPTVLVEWNFPNNPDNAVADGGISANLSKEIVGVGAGSVSFGNTGYRTYAARVIGWQDGVNTKYWQIEFDTTGYESIKLSSKQRSSALGPKDFKLQFRIGADASWTDISGGEIIVGNDYVSGLVENLQLPEDVNDTSSVFVRWVVTSTVSVEGGVVESVGSSFVDDIVVTGNAIPVSGGNTAPVAHPDSFTVKAGESHSGYVTGSDADDNALTFELLSDPFHGSIMQIYPDGSFTYTANSDYSGADSFTFKANDGLADSAPETISITVKEPEAPMDEIAPVFDFVDPTPVDGSWINYNNPTIKIEADEELSRAYLNVELNNGGFESGSMEYFASEGYYWQLDSSIKRSGSYSARSSQYLTGNDYYNYSSLTRTIVLDSYSGIGFWWKVSSEENNDIFSFYINGELKETISGEIDWTELNYDLPAGTYNLVWEYKKNSTISSGSDAGWVDDISIHGYAMNIDNSDNTAFYEASGFEDGVLKYFIEVFDLSDNRAVSRSRTFSLDTVAPTGYVYVSPYHYNRETFGDSVYFSTSLQEGGSYLDKVCIWVGDADENVIENEVDYCKTLSQKSIYSWPYAPDFGFPAWDSTQVADGEYNLYAIATDNAGNVGKIKMNDGFIINNYSEGSAVNPSKISTCSEFQAISNNKNWHYELINDIDCSESRTWNGGKGFAPIGELSGYLNGNNYNVYGIYMDNDYTGIISVDSYGKISGLNFRDVELICRSTYCGGFSHNIFGTIEKSSITGDLTCSGKCGGFASQHSGTIKESWADMNIYGSGGMASGFAGHSSNGLVQNSYFKGYLDTGNGAGIVGLNDGWNGVGMVDNSYAANTFSLGGSTYAGGLIGWQYIGSQAKSYWDAELSGLIKMCGDGGTNCQDENGLSTLEMKDSSSYDNWDFDNIWAIDPDKNDGYPYLKWQTSFSEKDNTAPVITLLGSSNIEIFVGDAYTDQGASALDDVDGDISSEIIIDNNVNTRVIGTYYVKYNVSDSSGNEAKEIVRTVRVVEKPAPRLSGGSIPLYLLKNDVETIFQTYDPLKDELTIYNDEDVIVLGIEEEFVEKSEAESIFESITNKKYLLEMILGEENTEGEANIPTKYSKLFKERKDSEDNKYKKITNFIFYGTETTIKLGEGERAGVVNSYKSAFGKLPETVSDWEDIIKIANGRWTSEINEVAEEKAKSKFRQIYLRDTNRENAHDDAALVVIAYGLRPSDRNIQSEKNAIGFFRGIFGYAPDSATDWDIVRAIAYSGAKR